MNDNMPRKECNDCMKDMEKRFDAKIDDVYKSINNKLDKSSAIAMLTIFVTLILATLTYIVYETRMNSVNINEIKMDVAVLKTDVGNIKNTFNTYDIIIKP